MKKDFIKIAAIAIIALALILVIWNLTDCASLNAGGKTAHLNFADSWRLRLSLLIDSTDSPDHSCGFTEQYSVQLGGLTYYLAQDECTSIYIPELDFCYSVSEKNHEALHTLLSKYEPPISF